MDIATTKMADTESETPPRSQPIKPLSFTNGTSLKKHHHHHPALPPEVVAYKECLKNHAASLGSHAVDGCGEFMPSPSCTPTDPTSLKCAACGCHRNFHRRDYNDSPFTPIAISTHFLEFNHHPLPPPPRRRGSSSSPSPPPQQPPPIAYAPHTMLALSTAAVADEKAQQIATPGTPTAMKTENQRGRKRFRTRFSQDQKEKMSAFAEKLGWKMQRSDEETVAEFCNEVGIRRGVLKVWMHNNKNTFGKKDNYTLPTTTAAATTTATATTNIDITRVSFDNNKNNNGHLQVSTNGSSSSS